MKYLVALTTLFFVNTISLVSNAASTDADGPGEYCIEKSDIRFVEFYYGDLLMVTTADSDYILMTKGCGDLSAAAYFEFRTTPLTDSSVCKQDTVVLLNKLKEPYNTCLIFEVLKEEN
jgi:hypothetical protein